MQSLEKISYKLKTPRCGAKQLIFRQSVTLFLPPIDWSKINKKAPETHSHFRAGTK